VVRSQFYQGQTGPTAKDASYLDGLTDALDASAETGDDTELIASESITFSAAGSTVTFGSSNPLTSGVIPGDKVIIAGSTADDGEYEIAAPITATTVDIVGAFGSSDGGSATGVVNSIRSLLSDLNLLRTQVRRMTGESDWYTSPTVGNNPVFNSKKLLYGVVDKTDISVPAAAYADISALNLTPYADSSGSAEGIMASTSTPSAGGLKKSEGAHFVDIVNASTGAAILVNGLRVYGYLYVDNIATPTVERVYFVYFDEATDAEVLITNLSTEQDGAATNFEIVYNKRTNLASIPEDFALFPGIEFEPNPLENITLQQAYQGGNSVQLSDAEGDMIIETDDTDSVANFIVRNEAGSANFFASDTTNSQAEIGDASIDVSLEGDTTVQTGLTFGVTDGQATFGGNVDANAGLDVSGTTNLGDGGTTNYSQFSATGDLDMVGTANTITKSDAQLNLTTTAAQDLAVNAAGLLDLDGATVNLDSAGAMSLDAAANSNINVTAGDLDVGTITSGDLNLSSAGDLTFNDSTWAGGGGTPDPLDFSDASNTNLTGFDTAPVSLIDAINQARAAVTNNFEQGDSIPGATDKDTNITIPNSIDYDDSTDFVNNLVFFRNGQKMRSGADAAANFDCYPGSTLTTVKFEFKWRAEDTLGVFKYNG
jgi:hypothetical protein